MSRIFLTGATGALGSSLLPALLIDGHEVFCLARSRNGKTADERITEQLGGNCRNVRVFEGNVVQYLGGMKEEAVKALTGRVDKMIHCAASIKFDQELAHETCRTNILGTMNTLDLASMLDVKEFHYISTAYIAGDSDVFSDEDYRVGQRFRNPYEESKFTAESIVRMNSSMKFSIYRPAIIVGNASDGTTRTFDGYYGFFKAFSKLKSFLARRSNLPKDIFFENGFMHLPIRVICSPDSTINLTPMDWLIDMLIKLVKMPSNNQAYNLVHPKPPLVQWVIQESLSHIGIKDVSYSYCGDQMTSGLLKNIQEKVDSTLNIYKPYITKEAKFQSKNLISALGSDYYEPLEISSKFLKKLLDFALSAEWNIK